MKMANLDLRESEVTVVGSESASSSSSANGSSTDTSNSSNNGSANSTYPAPRRKSADITTVNSSSASDFGKSIRQSIDERTSLRGGPEGRPTTRPSKVTSINRQPSRRLSFQGRASARLHKASQLFNDGGNRALMLQNTIYNSAHPLLLVIC